MFGYKLKRVYFLLEWLNAYATTFFFTLIYFHLQQAFGFGNRENLLLSAASGFVYIIFAWQAGKVAQKRGYFYALRVGFGTMLAAFVAGSLLSSMAGQCAVMIVWTVGMCFTWPPLEALVSEGESRQGLSRMVGRYNVVWSSGAAVAYFTGGVLLEKLGPLSLFLVPAAFHATQLAVLFWVEKKAAAAPGSPLPGVGGDLESGGEDDAPCLAPCAGGTATLARTAVEAPPQVNAATGKVFLRLAWLANPFAYVAMNTLIPLLPDLALKLRLSTALAGFVGSVWMFARLAAFMGLWQWTGWHYKFRWLAGAYVLMIACFAVILLVPHLWVIVLAELVFGLAVGLIYYSSLFYSMDAGETKGEHGGFHEALIGVGIFLGPAVGTTTLRLFPAAPNAGIWAVSGLLVLGLGALLTLKKALKH
jgi:MFS family permease